MALMTEARQSMLSAFLCSQTLIHLGVEERKKVQSKMHVLEQAAESLKNRVGSCTSEHRVLSDTQISNPGFLDLRPSVILPFNKPKRKHIGK